MAHSATASSLGANYAHNVTRRYAWIVFALTFGLLLSDYMSRQVLNAVFPLLKQEWALSDSQLGTLSGIVALMVGVLAFPLSLMADRWGRINSLALMAGLWSLATLACGLAQGFEHMFLARFFVGVGEAAYGSVGLAVVLSVFPVSQRATLTGAFMAGGMFGSVLGVALGGVMASHLGWRWAFFGMACFGLALSLLYPLVVRQRKLEGRSGGVAAPAPVQAAEPLGRSLRHLVNTRSVIGAYVGSGLQLFVGGAMMVWIPSYLNRYYGLATDRAGVVSAIFVLSSAAGMIVWGALTDRLGKNAPEKKISLAIVLCLASCALLSLAMLAPFGTLQLVLLALGMFLVAGTVGPAGAMVANLTPVAIHSTAFATFTLANNLLGLAPGPIVTGVVADRFGLQVAFQLMPLVSVAAAAVFYLAKRHYLSDMRLAAARGG